MFPFIDGYERCDEVGVFHLRYSDRRCQDDGGSFILPAVSAAKVLAIVVFLYRFVDEGYATLYSVRLVIQRATLLADRGLPQLLEP